MRQAGALVFPCKGNRRLNRGSGRVSSKAGPIRAAYRFPASSRFIVEVVQSRPMLEDRRHSARLRSPGRR